MCERIVVLNRGAVAFKGTVGGLRASLAGHQTYSIAVDGLSPVTLAELRGNLGSDGCRQVDSANGVVNLEVTFRDTGLTLSDVLGLVGASGARVVECAKHEQSFEEMFRTLFHRDALDHRARPPDVVVADEA